MTRANAIGVASVVCAGLAALPPYEDWKQPVNALLLVVAFVLAYRAGRTGAKAWFAVCGLLFALIGLTLWSAWREFA